MATLYSDTVDPSNNVRKLIMDEDARITLKADKIDVEYDTKIRKEMLLSSTTARNNINRQIYITIAVVSILTIAAILFQRTFPFLPSILRDLFIMALIGVGFIYIIVLYVDLQKRDKLDYGKIDFNSLMKPTIKQKPKTNGTGISDSNVPVPPDCIGQSCCVSSSIFVDNKCRKKEAFGGKIINQIKPFSRVPPYMSTTH